MAFGYIFKTVGLESIGRNDLVVSTVIFSYFVHSCVQWWSFDILVIPELESLVLILKERGK